MLSAEALHGQKVEGYVNQADEKVTIDRLTKKYP
jgi:hypothetical protein